MKLFQKPAEDSRINVGSREAARLVGVCEKTLLASDAPRQRIGRRILFNRELLAEWSKRNSKEKNDG